MRRWEDAIPHLEQALSKGVPNREETAILLAKAQARSGRRAEARGTLEELVRRNPYNANAISELVEMYLDDGDYARAVGICEEGLRANARNWSVHVRLAESLLLRNDPGDRERAQQALETVLLANPKDYHLYRVQGEDLVRRALNSKDDEQRSGLLAQAATVYEKGVNAVSGAYRGGLYNRLCYVRLALGQLENAEQAARQAIDAAPQHPNNYLALCAVLTGRKQWRALERTARKPRDLALGGRPTRILSLLYEVLGALCSGERLDEIGDQLREIVDAVRTFPDFRPIVPQWEFVRNSVPVDQIGGKERDVVSAIVSFMDGAIGRLTFVETLQEHLAPKPV
jgi:tetratricopeptide (TPR) repeat protein